MNGQADANGRPTCNIMQACTLTGVSRRTIYNWMKWKKIEWIKTAGGSTRIYTDTLWKNTPINVNAEPGR